MNIRVDLILPSERRSASGVSMKSIYRVGMIIVPLALLAIGAYVAMGMINLNRKVKSVEHVWRQTLPRQEQAMRVLKQGQVNDALLAEFQGWQHARIAWHGHLEALGKLVAPSIQFTQLRLSQVLSNDGRLGSMRGYRITLSGKAEGIEAEAAVQQLQQQYPKTDPMQGLVDRVDIPRYVADPANPANRVFQMDITYKPRPFKP